MSGHSDMKLSQFPEYLGWMSRACQALVQAKKASDRDDLPVFREQLENYRQYQQLAKKVNDRVGNDKGKADSSPGEGRASSV